MAVYVDSLRDYGWRLGPSCHMVADDLDELHRFASRIGLKRSWFQASERHPHYDLTASRRERAVQLGAVQVTGRELVLKLRQIVGRQGIPSP